MKAVDVIFSLIAGRIVGFLLGDFLKAGNINIGLYHILVLDIIFPLLSLFCLWLAYLIGKKLLFVFQASKFLLVGAVATVIDLKIFEFLVWSSGAFVLLSIKPLFSKSISFIISKFLKYWGNKHWVFQKHEKEGIYKETLQFFSITLIGLIIDVVVFYWLTEITGPQFAVPAAIWIKLSVVFAAITASFWNFWGYKFFVFKK